MLAIARETLVATIRQNFQPAVPLVAHFDGKLMPNVDGGTRELQDCMPVVVSGLGIEKLLGIPKLPAGTGALMGQKVVEFVREWPGVEDHLAGLCFDTTSSNTGIHTGAITVVQQAFNRRLLFSPVANALMYCGKLDPIAGFGHSEAVVFELMERYMYVGHELFVDNFYTSVPLAKALLKRTTLLCGTLRRSRKHIPDSVVSAKLKKGEVIRRRHGQIVVLK